MLGQHSKESRLSADVSDKEKQLQFIDMSLRQVKRIHTFKLASQGKEKAVPEGVFFMFTKVREKRCNNYATLKNVLRPSACPRLKK